MSHFFDYALPDRLIAQRPADRRDHARLMVLDRAAGTIRHHRFDDLPRFLRPHDLLVLNDTKVIPARVVGVRAATGGKWEGLFLGETDGVWELMAQTRGYAHVGERFALDRGGLTLELVGRTPDRRWRMTPDRPGPAAELLAECGHIPLPPYIRKGAADAADHDRYQTVYADRAGSVAAPTAGLHFTPELLTTLAGQGVKSTRVTLHVGPGTFAPVKVADPTRHAIHPEWAEVGEATVEAIRSARAAGGRAVAVGTTTTRTLEAAARSGPSTPLPLPPAVEATSPSRGEVKTPWPSSPPPLRGRSEPERSDGSGRGVGVTDTDPPRPPLNRGGEIKPFRGETALFIHPPFDFRAVDALVTNFHLPRTTLLLLVAAFAGNELLARAYAEAVVAEYRFFSYGDAMLVV